MPRNPALRAHRPGEDELPKHQLACPRRRKVRAQTLPPGTPSAASRGRLLRIASVSAIKPGGNPYIGKAMRDLPLLAGSQRAKVIE